MNIMQQRFCDEYLLTGNLTLAAKKAGYSENSASVQGCRLLTNAKIKKYIENKRAEMDKKVFEGNIAKISEILEFYTSTMRDGDASKKDRIKAADSLRDWISKASGDGGKDNEDENDVTELTKALKARKIIDIDEGGE